MSAKQSFSYNVCFCFRRIFRVPIVEPPEDIKNLFIDYSENGFMSIDNLLRFLIDIQKEEKGKKEDAQAIFNSLKHLNIIQRKGLNLESFFRYLLGDLNPPLSPSLGVHHDMNAPLSHYFLYTGHNSYLTGNQLSSPSSVKPIIEALKRGVRVIELDLWPNSTKNNAEVRHGGTLTSPVDVLKCLVAIKENAFVTSDYPVVITFEDHLPPNLQQKVAKMVAKTFKGMLFTTKSDFKEFPTPQSLKKKVLISTKPPKEYLESQNSCKGDSQKSEDSVADSQKSHFKEFPTPESLKRRVLISTRPPKEYLESQNSCKEDSQKSEDSEAASQRSDFEEFPTPESLEKRVFISTKPPKECLESQNSCEEVSKKSEDSVAEKVSEIEKKHEQLFEEEEDEDIAAPEYKSLIAIHAGNLKGGKKHLLNFDPDKVGRISLSEQAIENVVKQHGANIIRFTYRNLMRVYPKGTRITSSNYNPFVGWTHGAQMVAFNMQGVGKYLWIMQGMFRANGGCGYLKKPDFLLPGRAFDHHPKEKTLKVKIYLGEGWHSDFRHTHFDLFSPPDFYARVGIAGVPADERMERTKTINDSWLPVWNEEFEFKLNVPELALLRIEVYEEDTGKQNDFGGQTCLPISELRNGIRVVPLHDKKGNKYKNVRLLMRFQFLPH